MPSLCPVLPPQAENRRQPCYCKVSKQKQKRRLMMRMKKKKDRKSSIKPFMTERAQMLYICPSPCILF